MDDNFDKMNNELRRGTVILAALSQLDEPQYGYSLIQKMAERGMEIDEGTLYPLLRRLEKQGLLVSEWNTDGSRPRKYYVLSDDGIAMRRLLTAEWRSVVDVMERLLDHVKEI